MMPYDLVSLNGQAYRILALLFDKLVVVQVSAISTNASLNSSGE